VEVGGGEDGRGGDGRLRAAMAVVGSRAGGAGKVEGWS